MAIVTALSLPGTTRQELSSGVDFRITILSIVH
jgi:hypothetical protein